MLPLRPSRRLRGSRHRQVESKTFRTYRKWVYRRAVPKSDDNFVARLREHEGTDWYFEHGDGEHELALVDSHSVHGRRALLRVAAYIEDGAETAPDTDRVFELALLARSAPGQGRAHQPRLRAVFDRPSRPRR